MLKSAPMGFVAKNGEEGTIHFGLHSTQKLKAIYDAEKDEEIFWWITEFLL